jgi:hypothetical protein
MRCRHGRRRVGGWFNTFRIGSTSRDKCRESKRSFNGLRALAVLLVLSGLGASVDRARVFSSSVTPVVIAPFACNNGLNATNHLSERCSSSPPWNNPENTNTQGALHHGSRTAALNCNYSRTLLPSVACRWTRHSHYNSEVGS